MNVVREGTVLPETDSGSLLADESIPSSSSHGVNVSAIDDPKA